MISPSASPSVDAPARIGAYELLLPIGTGGMATVYLARREIMEGVWREFAVKLLHPQLQAEPSLAEQLLTEARLVAAIRHPNVVQVIEAGERGQAVYLVMEYVDGDTLAGLVRSAIQRGTRIPIPIVARIVIDGLLGLHAAHQAMGHDGPLELVHRDFSPQNLLVGCDGVTRLADFGIAKVIHRVGATATGVVKGKVSYMAPEQARGEALDRRCDVWAAGVVLWEALAAERLFTGSNDAALVLEIVAGPTVRRVSSVRPGVSAALDAVVADAMQRDRRARIADADELRRRLEAAMSEHGVADASDVAEYVNAVARDKLARRREAIAQATGRSRSERPAPLPAEGAEITVDTRGLTDETAVSADLRILPRRRRVGWLLIAAALLAAAGAWGWYGTRAPAIELMTALVETADDAERAAREVTPPIEREPPPPPKAPAPPGALRVHADAPVAQLHIGRRSVALPDPRADFEVPLTDAERSQPLSLTFVAADRRRAVVELAPSEVEITVKFPRARGAQRPVPRKSGPDIVADPYGGP